MPFIDDQKTNKDDTNDLVSKLTLISSVLMMTLATCLIIDKKLIDSYRRQNDVTQTSSLASYPTQNGSDVMTILLAMIMKSMIVADKI